MINKDLAQGRAKPYPVSRFLGPISHIKGSKIMPFGPAHTLGLAVSLVMSQLSFIILIPFSSLSNDLRCKLDDMDYKKGSQNLFICILSFRRSSNIDQSLHFFSLTNPKGRLRGDQQFLKPDLSQYWLNSICRLGVGTLCYHYFEHNSLTKASSIKCQHFSKIFVSLKRKSLSRVMKFTEKQPNIYYRGFQPKLERTWVQSMPAFIMVSGSACAAAILFP